MPGPVGGFALAGEPALRSEVRQRKRKGWGWSRKGKAGRTAERDRGSLIVSADAADGAGVEALEIASSLVVAVDFSAEDVEKRKVNGVEDAEAHELDGIALSRIGQSEDAKDFVSNCDPPSEAGGDETIDLEPVSPSGSKLEMELENGGDVAAHGNGDASGEGGEDSPVETPRKKRILSANMPVTPDTPLRRSSRRVPTATSPSDPYIYFSSKRIKREKRASEKKPSIEIKDENLVLPPSSKDLDLDGLPVLDVFSVYSCLRSFSTQLFLSPFSLKAFVAALNCTIANSLTDAIHYSILQALKPHLEALSEEDSEFASNCLRNLNWELLDTINWPLYVTEYLLIRNPQMCSGLKLLSGEYYDQPADSKLEILRHLCDDVVEVEIIRTEINKRMLELENNVDLCRVEMSDGNSDWCCLCGMEGSLICCDGCPAAFHSRCVGMAGDLLPEGEWFCPECMAQKFDGNTKILRSFEGAEVLGTDHHGRIYFSCCGYLLVSEPPDSNPSYRYYNRNDVHGVTKSLKSSSSASDALLISLISRHWGVTTLSNQSSLGSSADIDQMNASISFQVVSETISSLKCGAVEGRRVMEDEQQVNSSRAFLERCSASGKQIAEDSAMSLPVLKETEHNFSVDNNLLDMVQESQAQCSGKAKESSHGHSKELKDYLNRYNFARFTSSVAGLINKSFTDITKNCNLTVDDIISAQLRAIYKKSTNQYWSSVQWLPANALKEACGWCFVCKNNGEQECLLRLIETKILTGSRSRPLSIHPKDSWQSNIFSSVHHILQIEDSLHGLLSGPWHNAHHKKRWRRKVLKSVDATSLKYPLLTLELHLRRVALSSEWMKPVDSTLTVGSGSYILPHAVSMYPRQGGAKKQPRKNNSESKYIPDSGLYSLTSRGITPNAYWWRGGRLSRQVFNWNMIPRSLASKGGRQAGCKRIPGIIYVDGSDFARRSKYVAWRAAVEMSQNAAQLMYQVKDLDSNIRWNDLSNSHPLPKLGKDYRKSLKQMWKAAICQKLEEEGHVKYLVDFGKRKSIPDVVAKHGVLQAGGSNEGKKYWLDESHLPINLLKTFEAKKLESKLKKTMLKGCQDKDKCMVRKPKREKGFSYLLARGGGSDHYLCRHCGKRVLQRQGVNCQICGGIIHKRHFRGPRGPSTTTYTCYKCKENNIMGGIENLRLSTMKKIMNQYKKLNVDGSSKVSSFRRKREKIGDVFKGKDKNKKLPGEIKERKLEPRSKRRGRKPVKCIILAVRKSERLAKQKKHTGRPKKKKTGRKKRMALQNRKGQRIVAPKVSKEAIKWHKGQRTGICPPFWLNGLLWTRKAYDEHAIQFRENRVILPSPNSDTNIQPICSLCHQKYDSHVIYVGCENCGDWFHGDAFSLNIRNINSIRGFKCHSCRTQSMPLCPYLNRG